MHSLSPTKLTAMKRWATPELVNLYVSSGRAHRGVGGGGRRAGVLRTVWRKMLSQVQMQHKKGEGTCLPTARTAANTQGLS